MLVIDANAAIEIARGTKRGEQLASFAFEADKVIAPTLFVSETANATWKHVTFGNMEADEWLDFYTIVANEVDELVPDSDLLPEALAEAVNNKHPVYDMLYFVLARRTSSTLLTCDRRLAAVCKRNGVDCLEIVEL